MPTPPAAFVYPCENCGASLQFAPGQTALTCAYCGHVQRLSPGDSRAPARQQTGGVAGDQALRADPATGRALQWDAGRKAPGLAEIPLAEGLRLDAGSDLATSTRLLSCPNCGARIEVAAEVGATACPFCATPVVADPGESRLIRPQGVLPFVITEDQARAALRDWLTGLWFAPSGLKQYARSGRRMRGVYSPFWTFDAEAEAAYSGQRGDAYYTTEYVTEVVDGRTRQVPRTVRHIRWTPVSGRVQRSFNDVLVLASTALPRQFADGLTPWDLHQLADWRPEYLAGFEAEAYTIPLADGHALARAEMETVLTADARRAIGGDEQRLTGLEAGYAGETFKHILLPIWTAAYRYGGRSYRFVVNGQSGRVHGERPWSAWKIALAVVAALVLAAVALLAADRAGWVDLGGAGGFIPVEITPQRLPMPLPGTFDEGGWTLPPGAAPLPLPQGGYVIRGY